MSDRKILYIAEKKRVYNIFVDSITHFQLIGEEHEGTQEIEIHFAGGGFVQIKDDNNVVTLIDFIATFPMTTGA